MIVEQTARGVTWVTLATSASTLLCCALPALLVALGAGAVLASAVSVFPQLVWISEHKVEVFVLAGAMLTVAGWLQWRAKNFVGDLFDFRFDIWHWRIFCVYCIV